MRTLGVSTFTFITIVSCSAATRIIWVLDLDLWFKLFSTVLLILVAYMVFCFDSEMAVLESMRK